VFHSIGSLRFLCLLGLHKNFKGVDLYPSESKYGEKTQKDTMLSSQHMKERKCETHHFCFNNLHAIKGLISELVLIQVTCRDLNCQCLAQEAVALHFTANLFGLHL
jgi:hypothetical protein